jgi:hemerythrin-like domain-containing protein
MKRHPALAALSRDHHHGLVIARRLRQATSDTVTETAEMFLNHWHSEEKHHFRLEEEVLLPVYALHGDVRHPAVIRMLLDHVLIRSDAESLVVGVAHQTMPLQTLHNLGVRIVDHVTLEEREVFPLIEASLPDDELRALGERIHRAAQGRL